MTLLAIAAAASAAFNLACTGTVDRIVVGGQTSETYTRVFRFDLKANKWCADDCRAPEQILRVEPTRLVLRDQKADDTPSGHVIRESINRETGEHSSMDMYWPITRAQPMTARSGKCEVQPFTGFPEFTTKF